MKIAFITVHVGDNFGSNLQTIATSVAIKRTGNEPILINYCPARVTRKEYWKVARKSIKKMVWRVIYAPVFYKNTRIYEKYLAAHCPMTEPIYDNESFVDKCPKADIYLTGSDQVWNSKHNQGLNTRYYFDGILGKKVAFASSFGVEELPLDEYSEVKRMLSSYSAISVREDSAKGIVNSMGYEATHLLDPTFILNRDEWMQYASPRIMSLPYLLIYTPYNIVDKEQIYKTAHIIAKQKGLKIITFSWNIKSEPLADMTVKFASPGDFLSLMQYADFVITNSFHGTAFSINLNKQFLVFMPSGFGTRISSILRLCNLSDRLICDNQEDIYDNCINYDEVNKILEVERQRSMDFLYKALK